MLSEVRQKKIMEKLDRAQKCSLLGPQPQPAPPPHPDPLVKLGQNINFEKVRNSYTLDFEEVEETE